MANDALVPRRPDRGFSLVEMLIVVAIVAVMAAVALPNIAQYTRNYRIKGATQEVAGELQAARSKAIMTNTNSGVSFVVVDRDSYRFVQEDLPVAETTRLSGMKTLPQGVVFAPSALADRGPTLRFLRLGGESGKDQRGGEEEFFHGERIRRRSRRVCNYRPRGRRRLGRSWCRSASSRRSRLRRQLPPSTSRSTSVIRLASAAMWC